jgi:hypothetical protein
MSFQTPQDVPTTMTGRGWLPWIGWAVFVVGGCALYAWLIGA